MSGAIRVTKIPTRLEYAIGASYFSKAIVEHSKAVPGMHFEKIIGGKDDGKGKSWVLHNVWVGYPDAVAAVVARLARVGITVFGNEDIPEPESWRTSRSPYLFSTKDLREYQVEGVRFLLARAHEGALLADGMRLGKAQPIDEPVLTPNGWREIGSLAVGDMVIGADGRPTRVEAVYRQGKREVFKVTMTDGAETRCCAEHLWRVCTPKDKYAGRPGQVLTLAEIVDLGLVQPGTTNRKWFVPICPAPEFDTTSALLPLDPYLLGALLANGSLGRVIRHSGGPDQWELIADTIPLNMRIRERSEDDIAINPKKHGGPNPIRDALYELNLIGMHSERKFIPQAYLFASKEARHALLQGLFDNDGTVTEDGLTVEYNTVSPQLAQDVLFITRSLGGVAWLSTRIPTYTHKGERKNGQRDHRIRVSLPPDVVPFRLPRKVARFKPRSKFLPAHAIDRVEACGKTRCVCITVASPDGLYTTRDFIVTHNSAQSTIAARAFKTKTLVVCPSHVVGVWSRPPEAIEGPGEIAKWWPDAWKANSESGARGVVCLETVKPFAAQKVRRELLDKQAALHKHGKQLPPEEVPKLQETQADLIARAAVLQDAQVIVCHYDILYAWTDVLIEWGVQLLILDEMHILSGYQSRRSDELKTLRAAVPRVIGLTGTPVTNLPKNLHNLLDLLAPGRFGYFFAASRDGCYAKLFCDSKEKIVGKGEHQLKVWDHTGRSNLDVPDGVKAIVQEETLRERMKYLMLRRVKKDVDPQLPPKQRQIIDVSIPARSVIQITHKHLSGDPKELRRILDLAADAKLPTVTELAVGHVNEQEKIIVACHRRAFTEVVCAKIKTKVSDDALVVYTHGELPQKERDRRIHALKTHKGPGALVGTIDTISTGIDLSFAAGMIVAELSWEFHDLEQLEERLYAFGVDTKSFIQYVVARGTGDELILRGIINKLDGAEKLGLSAKDSMKRDLATRKVNAMERLAQALMEMQKGEAATGTRRRR